MPQLEAAAGSQRLPCMPQRCTSTVQHGRPPLPCDHRAVPTPAYIMRWHGVPSCTATPASCAAVQRAPADRQPRGMACGCPCERLGAGRLVRCRWAWALGQARRAWCVCLRFGWLGWFVWVWCGLEAARRLPPTCCCWVPALGCSVERRSGLPAQAGRRPECPPTSLACLPMLMPAKRPLLARPHTRLPSCHHTCLSSCGHSTLFPAPPLPSLLPSPCPPLPRRLPHPQATTSSTRSPSPRPPPSWPGGL